jgi:IS30 family transposase
LLTIEENEMTQHKRLSRGERSHIRALVAQGKSDRQIQAETGRGHLTVYRLRKADREGTPQYGDWVPGKGKLTLADREVIFAGLHAGRTFTAIAAGLGVHVSSVSREVKANRGRRAYLPSAADRRAFHRARRPKGYKLDDQRLCAVVSDWLMELWSPEQIDDQLRIDYPDEPKMWVSHETIYQSLYVQGRGELRRELARCLRTGRAQRKAHNRLEGRGKIADMVPIADRPAEVDRRTVPGHWEGDLIMGLNNRSAVGTLVERFTRYVILLHLPNGTSAVDVREAMARELRHLPAHLALSVTWDQGTEMRQHARFSADTGIAVYFCDPHSPWQRGTNENTNGLLRGYMPKFTDLSVHSQADLDRYARSLNNRPRKTLGHMTPSQKLAEVLAPTG